jgi:hypothetical protein
MNDNYRERLERQRAIAQENSLLPAVLRRNRDGNITQPFMAAFYKARLPDLIAAGDRLLPDLESPDYRTRSRAEDALDVIKGQIQALENPGT